MTAVLPNGGSSPFRVLLLENIDASAKQTLERYGCQVESLPTTLSSEELLTKIKPFHIIGLRSKTKITEAVLQAAPNLMAVGCFCIGTNQVDLNAARKRGVTVFNSPFANTRSVAELTIANIISLSRQLAQRSQEMHAGHWGKTHIGSYEVRGKTLGIIGYGHIGSQVGVMAEALGMRVYFFDAMPKACIGNTTRLNSIEDICRQCQFVTIHVPDMAGSKGIIHEKHFSMMQKGSYFLNLSRASVVDAKALTNALKSGHLAGAALDVFTEEPASSKERFTSPLRGLPNVILTPHIGGSTCEAQVAIGMEVSQALVDFLSMGSTASSVNMPCVGPPPISPGHVRLTNAHENTPGALSEITKIVAKSGCNIAFQVLRTREDVGYLIMDVDRNASAALERLISELKVSIRTRLLHEGRRSFL